MTLLLQQLNFILCFLGKYICYETVNIFTQIKPGLNVRRKKKLVFENNALFCYTCSWYNTWKQKSPTVSYKT